MNQENRNQRLRLMVKQLNKDRKKQARQIDLLCHDLIDAQRVFVRRLETIGFAANLYKSFLGVQDTEQILQILINEVQSYMPSMDVNLVLRQSHGCKIYPLETTTRDEGHPVDAFDGAVVEAVCRANKPCHLEDLLGMGLPLSPQKASRTQMTTLPLPQGGRCMGFIVLTSPANIQVHAHMMEQITLAGSGISQAVLATEKVSQSA
ncbi:MAG: hypothetical protein K9N55_02475 [Phycisphaerae bacterium]|nr:hypothetical protein [Phycisphaerae bacterium]